MIIFHIFFFSPLSLFPHPMPSIATPTQPHPAKPPHPQVYLAVFAVKRLWRFFYKIKA